MFSTILGHLRPIWNSAGNVSVQDVNSTRIYWFFGYRNIWKGLKDVFYVDDQEICKRVFRTV